MPELTGPGRNGYDFDTFEGENEEGFIVGQIISKILFAFGLVDKNGFCSTAREWHILLDAISAGLEATTLGDVPKCPPRWIDEQQYWDLPSKITNCIKCQWPSVVAFGTALLGALISGVLKI